MNTTEMIQAAKAEITKHSGYNMDTKALEAAINAGLGAADKIALGGTLVAHINGATVTMIDNGNVTATIPIDALNTAQIERMTILKGVQAGTRGTSTGRI